MLLKNIKNLPKIQVWESFATQKKQKPSKNPGLGVFCYSKTSKTFQKSRFGSLLLLKNIKNLPKNPKRVELWGSRLSAVCFSINFQRWFMWGFALPRKRLNSKKTATNPLTTAALKKKKPSCPPNCFGCARKKEVLYPWSLVLV